MRDRMFFMLGLAWGCFLFAGHVKIRNGDRFQADFLRQEKGNTVVRPAWGGEEMRIPSRYLDAVILEPATMRNMPHILHLTGGDRVPVEWIGMEPGRLRVKTFWGRELEIDAGYVESVHVYGRGGPLFTGPGRLKDWTVTPATRFNKQIETRVSQTGKGFAVMGGAKLKRALPVKDGPMVFSLEVEHPPGHHPGATIQISGLLKDGKKALTQQMSFSSRVIDYRLKSDVRVPLDNRRLVLPRIPVFEDSTRHVRFGIAPGEGSTEFKLELNGHVVHTWDQGDGITFNPNTRMEVEVYLRSTEDPVFLKSVELREGTIREPSAEDSPGERETDMDTLVLRNGDRLRGTVRDMNGSAILCELQELDRVVPISLDRVAKVEWRSVPRRVPRRHARDVRVFAQRGRGRVTGRLVRADGETLGLRSDIWDDTQSVPLSLADRIQFNPHSLPVRKWKTGPGSMSHLNGIDTEDR